MSARVRARKTTDTEALANCHLRHISSVIANVFVSTAPLVMSCHRRASALISTTLFRLANWRNEKTEKLWKINCAIAGPLSARRGEIGDGLAPAANRSEEKRLGGESARGFNELTCDIICHRHNSMKIAMTIAHFKIESASVPEN